MVLKNIVAAFICTMLLAWGGLSQADEYRPDEFLGLDLPRAALSPKPLGPPAHFTPGPLDVTVDRGNGDAQARAEPKQEPEVAVRKTSVLHARTEKPVVQARAEKPRGAARTKLARRHSNPLDAQAFDTRIQVWPCKSGGICDWKR